MSRTQNGLDQAGQARNMAVCPMQDRVSQAELASLDSTFKGRALWAYQEACAGGSPTAIYSGQCLRTYRQG